MPKRNLCDTCLHRPTCRQEVDQQWGRMAHCAYYERLILMGHTPGQLHKWVRTATPPEEDEVTQEQRLRRFGSGNGYHSVCLLGCLARVRTL